VFGRACRAVQEQRVATVQTLGGSGALKVGSDFLKRLFPVSQVWISDPSWENHRVVFVHDLFHRRQEHVALGRPAVPLESAAMVGCYCKGLLLHRLTTQSDSKWWTCSALP